VLKPFGDDIWIVDGGIAWMKLGIGLRIPFTTRMAVIRLPAGALLLWSPVEPTESLRAEVDALGRVAHLMSPNRVHYVHIGAWKKLYPYAIVLARAALMGKKARGASSHLREDPVHLIRVRRHTPATSHRHRRPGHLVCRALAFALAVH
jgi:hypothetical protein